MESPSVCARALHAVWHRSIWHGADCETPFSRRHYCPCPNFSSCLTSVTDFFSNSGGWWLIGAPQLSGQTGWYGFSNPKKRRQWWTLCERDVLWSCLKPVPYWPTGLSEAREKGSVPGVQTEQLLLCLQSSEDMTQLSWEWYAWPSSVKLGNFWRYGKKSRNVSNGFLMLTAESKWPFRFKSHDWQVTCYANILYSFWQQQRWHWRWRVNDKWS